MSERVARSPPDDELRDIITVLLRANLDTRQELVCPDEAEQEDARLDVAGWAKT